MAIHTIRGVEHQPAAAQGRRVAYIRNGVAIPAPKTDSRAKSTLVSSQSQLPAASHKNEGKSSYFQAFMAWFWSLFSWCCPSKKG
jgi:hypothetical protein